MEIVIVSLELYSEQVISPWEPKRQILILSTFTLRKVGPDVPHYMSNQYTNYDA